MAQTFTTYINARRSGSVDAEFAQLEQRANKSLSGIQAKAEQANRALAGLTSGRGTGGVRTPITPQFLGSFDQATAKTERLRLAQERLARENSGLVRSLRTTGQTLQVVQGPLGPIAGRVNAAADALARMTGVTLGLAGAGAALFAYANAANRFVEIRSKLAPLYDSQVQVNDALEKVAGIAQRARSGLEPVVDLYAKMKLAADQFGLSQERALRITELASKAATLSGGTAQSREAGLYQFAQGFGSGSLSGDELKSVRENTLGLAKALSEGLSKLPEFKGVDVSIGKLKELGAEGKLTADVIARAMEASAGSIEESFKKLPPTMSSAFTSLGNSATMFVGRFEQATGIVGTLATGIKLIGDNLGFLLSALGGVAAGWAAVAAAARAGDVVRNIQGQVDALRQQQAMQQNGLRLAQDQRALIVGRQVALKGEEQQVRANIVALERQLAVQRQLATDMAISARANPAGPGRRLGAEASAAARQTTKELADEIERLTLVQGKQTEASGRLKGATEKLDEAKKNAAKSSSLLKSGAMGLLGAFNPLGIAVGLATGALLAWATSASQAEKNARKIEDAQRSLAQVIDYTTGKIIEQNEVLLRQKQIEGLEGAGSARENYGIARNRLAALGDRFMPVTRSVKGEQYTTEPRLTATQMQARSLFNSFNAGGSVIALQRGLDALAKADPSLRSLADQAGKLGGETVNAAQQVGKLQANLRLLAGKNDPETLRRAQGDFSGGRSADQRASGKTDAQVAAEIEAERKRLRDKRYAAEVQMNEQLANLETRRSKLSQADYIREGAQIKASYDAAIAGIDRQDQAATARAEREEQRRQRAHERELARIQRENEARDRRTESRQNILGRYSEEPRAVVRATRDIGELNDLVGKTMNGVEAITKENPLGQGLYTKEMAKADADNIREGLQRPYNEFMESRQRERNIQLLILEGRDLEAQALERSYELHDAGNDVTMAMYQSILANLQAEERINDALEQRERLMAPLRESVGALRGDIASAIEDFLSGGNPAKGLKNIAKGLLKSFNRNTAVEIAERVTGGLDARVRELIRGSVSVDERIANYISALNTSGEATQSLGGALNSTANAAINAAAALNGIAGSPGVVGAPVGAGGSLAAGGAGIIGAASSALYGLLGAKLPSSFYKPGVQVGGGIGDDVIYKALGGLGAVITENLRPQSRQNAYYAAGITDARVSKHTTTQEAFDVRLPKGMSFATATALIEKAAREMGVAVTGKLDETVKGGTGRHGHYTFERLRGAYAGYGGQPRDPAGPIGGIGSAAQRVVGLMQTLGSIGQQVAGGPRSATGGVVTNPDGSITVTRSRIARNPQQSGMPTQVEQYNEIGKVIGGQLDKILGTKFIAGVGAKLGTALQGAQTGMMVSGVAKMLGVKQSNTGAAIGGAAGAIAGSFIPVIGPMIGSAIGGLLGGTIGGLFKKTKFASSTITGSGGDISVGDAAGRGAAQKQAAGGMAGSVGDALFRITDQLGAAIGNFAVSIGVGRNGRFVVDETGAGRVRGPGTPSFATEEEAIRYALMDAIRDGAITGLSAASQAILRGGKDLERQLAKVQIIESIPKRLMALKDPVRFAVTELNREFEKMIAYLKEGGASAAQFAEAQELYNLERARAIEQAAKQNSTAIQDYIDNMLGGSNSPLNRRTVYDNARGTLAGFEADVAAGKVVDSNDFLKAVTNFQDASKALYGSSESFFADFNLLLGLLNQAKNNVGAAAPGTTPVLPPSPFSDAAIQSLITGTNATKDAVDQQTQILGGYLATLVNGMGTAPPPGTGSTAIGQLPSSGGGSRDGGSFSDTLLHHV